MKTLLTTLLLVWSINLFGQSIEFTTGPNINQFYDLKTPSNFKPEYTPRLGYSFGLAIDDIKIRKFRFRLTARYDEYLGEFIVPNHSNPYGPEEIHFETTKSVFSLGIIPVNLTIFKHIDWNFGLEFSKLINDSFTYDGKVDDFNSTGYFGLSNRLAYNLNINEKITLTPQYLLYSGLSDEFTFQNWTTISIRHLIGLGVKYHFK